MTEITSHKIPIEVPDRVGLRRFALTWAALIAGLFGLFLPWVLEFALPIWPWLVAGLAAAAGLILPERLGLAYTLWMRLGLLLNKITSPIVLGIMYFLIMTPIGLLRRLKTDTMQRKFAPDQASYRVQSTPLEKDEMERPY